MSTSVDGDQPSSTPRSVDGDRVELLVSADAGLSSVIRVVGTGLAARLGFDVARVEDIRLALDELCFVLLDQADPGSTLRLGFRFGTDGSLAVRAGLHPRPEDPPRLDPLARQVLSAISSSPVAEEHDAPSGDWLGLRFDRQGSSVDDGTRGP